ncbi:hypothetical protein BpHYR1_019264 [Brachionus plicatilis]|uniref:Uncharacterized protein n=1 Tax=Brachionus plicatilis TaxID=10195 RepID=A0A3M7PE96_BRAPC|nr:hypothetical protein BpHYR1_019264 [Brachionus plicatilis]
MSKSCIINDFGFKLAGLTSLADLMASINRFQNLSTSIFMQTCTFFFLFDIKAMFVKGPVAITVTGFELTLIASYITLTRISMNFLTIYCRTQQWSTRTLDQRKF